MAKKGAEMVPMRRKDRELGEPDALAVVDRCHWAVLSTVNGNLAHPLGPGAPCAVPVSPVRVGDVYYIHSALQGHKIGNMEQDNRVCLTFVGMAENDEPAFSVNYESAVVYARAFPVEDPQEKRNALVALCKRHAPSQESQIDGYVDGHLRATAVWRLEPVGLSGKRRQFESPTKV